MKEHKVSIYEANRGRENYGKNNVWRETDGHKKHCWIDEHAGIKRNCGKSGKSK